MANFSSLRSSLATSLSAAGRVVYAYPNESTTPPALVLVPGSPYVTPVAIGGLNNRINVRFELTAVVAASDNQAALAKIESLMLDVFTSLPSGASVDAWTQPLISEINGQQMLTSQITVELVTTNNGN